MKSQRVTRVRPTDRGKGYLFLLATLPAILLFLALQLTAQEGESEEVPTVTHKVRIATSLGVVAMELYGEDAPKAVENFITLCDSGFYDGLLFHRIYPGFLVQAGCPKTRDSASRREWGKGGASAYGAPFSDELDPRTPSFRRGYRRGVVAMANSGPNTNMSQFFILVGDASDWLPATYTIFGYVPDMTVVDSIASTPLTDVTDQGGRPATPIRILSTFVSLPGE